MKKLILSSIIILLGISSFFAQEAPVRMCSTAEDFFERLESDPLFRENIEAVERITNVYTKKIREEGALGLRSGVVTIPVVVHVVYANSTENVSDAQIQSQIDVLNEDFRRMNADLSTVPGAFSGLPADIRIQFALAARDPDCNPTSGITRTSTAVSSFDHSSTAATATARNPVKFSSSGGADGWPSDEYLNIWVCDLVGGDLGYASFPADLAARPDEDGVVIDYEAFGDTGTADAPFDLGRTGTHEIGHWLNLRHIWGDDDFAGSPLMPCEGSDLVDDTPNQEDRTTGCPSFPQVSCMNGPNGDLYVNYMDYVDDDCMVMFTQGQATRMAATLFGVRSSIVASDALVPPGDAPDPDLWSQDTPDDTGLEPNPSMMAMYQSVDIWVRNTDDGFTNQEHQNPVYRSSGSPNYVYVRVRNRGCSGSQSGTVRLYWAKAGSGLSWPSPWDGTVTMPALMGNPISSQSVTVDGGEFQVLEFPWVVPNPDDYASIGGDRAHFCLLSRIETSPTTPFGMTFPETGNLYQNVQNNNNIVWKNVTVATPGDGGRLAASVIAGNFFREAMLTELRFDLPAGEGRSIFDFGNVIVDLGTLFDIWERGNQVGENIEVLGNNRILLTGPPASLQNMLLPPRSLHNIEVFFEPSEQNNFNNVFKLNMAQLNQNTNEIIGGQIFIFKVLGAGLLEPAENPVATVDCPAAIPQDCKFPVTVRVDMNPVPAPNHRLGNFTGVLQWNPAELALTGPSDIRSGFNGFTNLDPVAGTLTFNGAKPGGEAGLVEILQTTFEAIGPIGSTPQISVDFIAMAAADTYADLSARATIRGCRFPIIPAGVLGDVNGDGLVNSTDAAVILAYSVGNPVPPDMQARINSEYGDVNTDGTTNPADALIILTYDVGLPVPYALGENFCPSELQTDQSVVRSPAAEVEVWVHEKEIDEKFLEIPVYADLRKHAHQLGSFHARLRWNSEVWRLIDYEGGTSEGFGTPTVNEKDIGSGVVTIADAHPLGGNGLVHLFTLRMEVLSKAADAGLEVDIGSMTSTKTFENLNGVVRHETAAPASSSGKFSLRVHPNPFRQEVNIQYRLDSEKNVALAVFDFTGRKVYQLFRGPQVSGDYRFLWKGTGQNGERLPTGVYLLRLNTEDGYVTEKLILTGK